MRGFGAFLFSLLLLPLAVGVFASCGNDDDDDNGEAESPAEDDDDNLGDDDNISDDDADDCFNNPVTEKKVQELKSQMTLQEKVNEMTAPRFSAQQLRNTFIAPMTAGGNERLGIPALRIGGSSRGAIRYGTAFPVSIARGAAWNVDLEERIGEALGREMKAVGGNVLAAPTINVLRHPGWGRSQETYGEDPFLLARLAVASINGTQHHVMSQVKHFALNSIENDRMNIDILVDERTLREVYLPQFKAAVQEACVGSVMSSYNKVNGQHAGENEHLLRDILKGDWAFEGYVASDWFLGTRSTVDAANNGLDVEMPMERFYGDALYEAVLEGEVEESVIDDAVSRILRMKFAFGLFDKPPEFDPDMLSNPEHTQLALEAAREGIVLLRNESETLPLPRDEIGRIAVVGPLAGWARLGDEGSSKVNPDYAISPLAGLLDRAGSVEIERYAGMNAQEAAAVAARADAVVVVAAYTIFDEGERNLPIPPFGGDRTDLGLPDYDVDIIQAVTAVNDRVIVVIEAGGAVTVEPWIDQVEALLMAWYPGMEGGNAIADVIFGDTNPSGKLPLTVPHSEDPLYEFGTGQPTVEYGYYHGYRWFDHEGLSPRYPFGFGLSYTNFAYSNLNLSETLLGEEDSLLVSFDVSNVGSLAGKEVAQLYVSYPDTGIERFERELKGFKKVDLEPGETATVNLLVSIEELAYYDVEIDRWQVAPGQYVVRVGSSSRDLPLEATFEVN